MSVEAASTQTRAGALALAVAVLTASLVLAALARAQASPVPGGSVPSTLSLSLGEPSPFRRVGAAGTRQRLHLGDPCRGDRHRHPGPAQPR